MCATHRSSCLSRRLRVAIVCGAGTEFIADAAAQKADVLVTGEARFHDCLAAHAQGLSLLLPGHYATERTGMEELAGRLQSQFPGISVWASGINFFAVSSGTTTNSTRAYQNPNLLFQNLPESLALRKKP